MKEKMSLIKFYFVIKKKKKKVREVFDFILNYFYIVLGELYFFFRGGNGQIRGKDYIFGRKENWLLVSKLELVLRNLRFGWSLWCV